MEPRHLSSAPLVEALIDIQVGQIQAGPQDLKRMHESIADKYPTVHRAWKHRFDLSADGEGLRTEQRLGGFGFRYLTADESWVVQTRVDGFALSRLRGYEKWDTLRSEAEKLWAEYREIAKPTSVRRVAVRYINRIEIPLPLDELSKHFNILLQVPDRLPQGMAQLFIRTSLPYDEDLATITMVAEPPTEDDAHAVFILDIDVFRSDVEWAADSVEIWQCLDVQRHIKNQVFFACLTDDTLRRYV